MKSNELRASSGEPSRYYQEMFSAPGSGDHDAVQLWDLLLARGSKLIARS